MRGPSRRVARRLAAAVLVTLLAGPVPAAAAARPAQPAPALGTPEFVELEVTSVDPPTVVATTEQVTVRGTLRNTGDRDVRDLAVRLQRAPALATTTELRTALRTAPEEFDTLGEFTDVVDLLSPGEVAGFTLTTDVTGAPGESFALQEPGVYPVLVNVNGEPDFGSTARLDAADLLLPVLSLPVPSTPDPGDPAPAEPAPADPAPGVTVLWPLADRPRLLPGAPGATALLSDDELASSLAAGGRLDGLLDAVSSATAADPTGRLAASLCLAVDPDLLRTAEAMAAVGGYRVRTEAGVVDGTGGPAATRWLARLRATAAGGCVSALPWAQADLDAAARSGLDPQLAVAVVDGAAQVTASTGVPVVAGLTSPVGGRIDEDTAAALAGLGQTALVLSADAVTDPAGARLAAGPRAVRTPGGLGSVLTDPATAQALAATGSDPATAAGSGGDSGSVLGQVGVVSRAEALQDALGAVSWPALVGLGAATDGTEPTGRPDDVVVAPPPAWTADAEEAGLLLSTVRGLLDAGAAVPRPLPELLATAATGPVAALATGVPTGPAELSAARTADVVDAAAQVRALAAATRPDLQAGVDPVTLVDPLEEDLVRSLSTAPQALPAAGVAEAVRRLFAQVSLQAPGGPYTLASDQSPLLLVVRNDLPVAVDVQVTVDGPPGLQVTDIGVQQLPANGARQLVLPTSVGRTGQFAVDVALSTADGQSMGPTTRVLVRSTAYGTATAAVTAAAAGVLLLLVARRLYHRFRGQPDPADEDRPLL